MTLRSFWRWLTTGRRRSELACPDCRVVNVVPSHFGDEIVCGACGAHFWHGERTRQNEKQQNVTSMPMTWATAYRLVANELGVTSEQFEAWVAEASAMPEYEREKWLADVMFRAARKRMMRGER